MKKLLRSWLPCPEHQRILFHMLNLYWWAIQPEYSGRPSITRIFWIRVLMISAGIEAAVVASPLIIDAQKWQRIPSSMRPVCKICCLACEYVANCAAFTIMLRRTVGVQPLIIYDYWCPKLIQFIYKKRYPPKSKYSFFTRNSKKRVEDVRIVPAFGQWKTSISGLKEKQACVV